MIKAQPWNRWLHRLALHFPLAALAHQLFGCSHRCSHQPTKNNSFLEPECTLRDSLCLHTPCNAIDLLYSDVWRIAACNGNH